MNNDMNTVKNVTLSPAELFELERRVGAKEAHTGGDSARCVACNAEIDKPVRAPASGETVSLCKVCLKVSRSCATNTYEEPSWEEAARKNNDVPGVDKDAYT